MGHKEKDVADILKQRCTDVREIVRKTCLEGPATAVDMLTRCYLVRLADGSMEAFTHGNL